MKTKTLTLIALTMAVVAPADTAFAQATADKAQAATAKKMAQFPSMTVAEVQKALEKGKATVIDVNPLESYNAGHIPGALHFGTVKKELAGKLPKDKNALILAYCGGPT